MSLATVIALLTLFALLEITPKMNDLTGRDVEQCRDGTVDLQARSVRNPLARSYSDSDGTSALPRPLFVNCGGGSRFSTGRGALIHRHQGA